MKKETVLLVEDEPSVLMLTASALNKLGFRVFMAEDGAKGLSVFEASGREIDLLLADYHLPCMNGFQLATILRIKKPELNVILMSGSKPDAGVTDTLESWRGHFLAKPFPLIALERAVRWSLSDQR